MNLDIDVPVSQYYNSQKKRKSFSVGRHKEKHLIKSPAKVQSFCPECQNEMKIDKITFAAQEMKIWSPKTEVRGPTLTGFAPIA